MNEMTKTVQQGRVDFSLSCKIQTTWGFQEALTFTLEGIGATVFFGAFLFGQFQGAVLGLAILIASGALLLAHLGNPKNMIYVMANFRHSWMSRGAVLIPLFIVLGVIAIAGSWSAVGHPILAGVFLLLTLFVLVKSGLVMTAFPAIDFWNGGMLPILFALNGIASGLAILALFPGGMAGNYPWLFPLALVLIVIVTALFILTIRNASRAAKASVDLINGTHFHSFYSLGVALGTVGPLILGCYIAVSPSAASFPVLLLIAALRVSGDVLMRNVILQAGIYDKVR